ncbi:MAG: sensor histidine kinase [Oscillospiraceae bacterium]|nr:sensor histidine kinase [Oscillospiraceae bacterium]
MEQLQNIMGMLDLMVRPAFCVRDGLVAGVNREAQRFLIQEGTPVAGMLHGQEEEYRDLREGCLYASLEINGQRFGASVTRQADYDIIALEQDADQAELNALALAAQELRGPLSNVLTVTDRLFPSIGDDPAAQSQAARINRGLFQLLRIVSNMADAAHYSQDVPAAMEVREVSGLLGELFQGAGDLIGQAGITLSFRNLEEQVFTLVNVEMLERAVYNMLSNAIKFTPKGGTVEASLCRRGRKLYLTVQDSGTGVDPKLRPSVHARYLRQPGIEDGRHGIGLGMVLIRSAAAAHGGTVLMEHPEGRGARITLSMEIRIPDSTNLQSPAFRIDYAGDRDHGLIELSDTLPAHLYQSERIN